MCCARDANINAISAHGSSPAVPESSSTRRIFSPVAVPPGSRVSTTLCPALRSAAASARTCVLLPVPSSPSNVMKLPLPRHPADHSSTRPVYKQYANE